MNRREFVAELGGIQMLLREHQYLQYSPSGQDEYQRKVRGCAEQFAYLLRFSLDSQCSVYPDGRIAQCGDREKHILNCGGAILYGERCAMLNFGPVRDAHDDRFGVPDGQSTHDSCDFDEDCRIVNDNEGSCLCITAGGSAYAGLNDLLQVLARYFLV